VNVLIVDDEAPARRRLARMLSEVPGIVVAGEAFCGASALDAIERLHPDVVLLDIEMPELDGLSLASRAVPPVIFVTAHERHAPAAFDVDAIDYLLKPVRRERLIQALDKAARRIGAGPAQAADEDGGPARIVTFDRGTTRIFDARRLTRFWASDKYTVFLAGGVERLTAETLSTLEKRLAPFGFVRVHRAELIRASAVRSLGTRDGVLLAELEDGQIARVSRRSLAGLKVQLSLP
jgi:DNA-binding LytR/AlgR family response regulator